MPNKLLSAFARLIEDKVGWKIVRCLQSPGGLPEATPRDLETLRTLRYYTMTSPERQWALINAVKYAVRARVPGDIVECGVWRGGASMAAARTLLGEETHDRKLWLYDTYAGMTAPGIDDRTVSDGRAAQEIWLRQRRVDGENNWCRASIEDVRSNMERTGYPQSQIRYIKGPVEQTLFDKSNLPDLIAILRLDTDWHDSTRVELEKLYPLLSPGGVLIVDDYGHWQGARRAVDSFFDKTGEIMLLNRIDDTGRIGIKPNWSPSAASEHAHGF